MCFYIAISLQATNSTKTYLKVHKNMHSFAKVLFEKTKRLKKSPKYPSIWGWLYP